jgi:hypothetical protein
MPSHRARTDATATDARRSSGLVREAEPAFNEMMERWLAEGDRLSEVGQSVGQTIEGATSAGRRRRLPRLVRTVGSQANRYRVAVMSGVGLLVFLAVIGASHQSVAPTASVPAAALAAKPTAAPAIAPQPEAQALAAPAPVPPSEQPSDAIPDPPPANAAPTVRHPTTLRIEAPAVIDVAKPALRLRAPGGEPTPELPVTAPRPRSSGSAIAVRPLGPAVTATGVIAAPAPRPATAEATPLEGCRSALKRERAREALVACQIASDSAPASADALVLLAHANFLAGRQGETLRLAQRAVEMDPRSAEAYLLIGNVQQSTGNTPRARRAYESYLQLAPHGAHASEVRAVLATLQQRVPLLP